MGANPAGIDREDRSSNDQSQPCPQKQDDEREQHGCHARDSQRARACTRTAESVVDGVLVVAIGMKHRAGIASHGERELQGRRAEPSLWCAPGSSARFICSIALDTRSLVPWPERYGHVAPLGDDRAWLGHGGSARRSRSSTLGLAARELLLSAMLPARALAHRPVDSSPPETSYLVTKNV